MNVLSAERSRQIRGFIFSLLGGTAWGFSGACGQFLFTYYDVDPAWLASVRMIAAGALLMTLCLIVPLWRNSIKRLIANRQDIARLFIFAFLGLALCQFAYLMAIKYSNAATATVLQYIGPVLIVVYVCLSTMKVPSIKEFTALVCVLIGIFLIATHGNPYTMVLSVEGLVWGLAAAVAVAVYTLLPRSLMNRYKSLPVTALAHIIGGVALCIIVRPWSFDMSLDGVGYAALAGMIVLGTAIGFALYLQGVSDIGAAKASLISSVEAVSATLFAVLWLHTPFALVDFVGFACIMATVILLAKPQDEK